MDGKVARAGFFQVAGTWVESPKVQGFITVLILLNAVILGMETSQMIMGAIGPILEVIDSCILAVFVVEIVLRIAYRRGAFFRDGWSLFDLIVVGVALVPASDSLAVLRALRVLRVLRLVTVLPRLKMIVQALLSSLPGLGMIMMLQGLIFYVGAVVATKLFAGQFPEWFGSLGASLYTLFQVMTLESWSMGIVRPVMETFPYAWIFFIPFILIATFTMLNLFIAVIVNAMQVLHEEESQELNAEIRSAAHEESETILSELRALRAELAEIKRGIALPASEEQQG